MTEEKKNVQSLTAEDLLTSIPYVNEKAEVDRRKNGTAVVSVPMKKSAAAKPPLSWFLPYSSHKRVELDQLGLAVIDMCDGKRSVEQIIELFAEENKLSFRESQVAVMQFVRQLTERGIIVLVGLSSKGRSQR